MLLQIGIPKVFFAKSNVDEFNPPEEIAKIYRDGSFKQGDAFNISDCHKLIDYYRKSLEIHKDWNQFGFKFSDTENYSDIGGFYHDVEHQGYNINFINVDADYIDNLVENGKLYLFKIYNKDFSSNSKGRPNLHTLYWKALFDENNLKNIVYKLNGDAEIFYRKASIEKENRIIHPRKQPIVKKNEHAKKKQETSLFEYDLIKDKRYTIDQYQFHVSITMNFGADGRKNINEDVIKVVRQNSDVNVIGIDRGERNLLYISVVNAKGEMLHQQTLNVVENDKGYAQDYHRLLDNREKEMDAARKNWKDINSIKELKEGYLSQAIHIITELMEKYQAVVVLEDLNFGFMNGRKKVGKQVYQKFEKMLIDKLNYFVDKKRDMDEAGGVFKAYQLTSKFESFEKLGKQSGFLFYIPAWNTSKIDPTTGFVNLLHPKYVNETDAKQFIKKFKSIKYNMNGFFEFNFSYSDFISGSIGSIWLVKMCKI